MTKGSGRRKRIAASKAWSKKHKWINKDSNTGYVTSSTDGGSPSLEDYSCLGENQNPVDTVKMREVLKACELSSIKHTDTCSRRINEQAPWRSLEG